MEMVLSERKYGYRRTYKTGVENVSGDPATTLEKLIHGGSAPDIYQLSADLFQALESVYQQRQWFGDICEKNILYTKEGRFILSEPDKLPCSTLPDTASYSCKEYWMPVFSYLLGRVRLIDLKPGEVPGILFNYLQAMFLILRVRLVFVDQEGYYNSPSLFDQLPMIMDKLVPEYRALFTRLLTHVRVPSRAELKQISLLFMEKVVLSAGEETPAPKPAEPVVRPSKRRRLVKRDNGYLQNGDLLVVVILAMALTFSVWLWSGQ
jgi:hypothetical protein